VKDIPSAFAGDVNIALAQGPTAVLAEPDRAPGTLESFASRLAQWLRSPRPYLMLLGFALFLGFWYLTVEVWKLPRFSQMPGPTAVITEWLDPDPVYGLSIYSPEYYQHIWVSTRRVLIAFLLATATGVPLGLFLGWSQRFKEYAFPVFELLSSRLMYPLFAPPIASGRNGAKCSGTSSRPARCHSSSPVYRFRWASPGFPWSRARWCRGNMGSAT
jgi:hypothetical protein